MTIGDKINGVLGIFGLGSKINTAIDSRPDRLISREEVLREDLSRFQPEVEETQTRQYSDAYIKKAGSLFRNIKRDVREGYTIAGEKAHRLGAAVAVRFTEEEFLEAKFDELNPLIEQLISEGEEGFSRINRDYSADENGYIFLDSVRFSLGAAGQDKPKKLGSKVGRPSKGKAASQESLLEANARVVTTNIAGKDKKGLPRKPPYKGEGEYKGVGVSKKKDGSFASYKFDRTIDHVRYGQAGFNTEAEAGMGYELTGFVEHVYRTDPKMAEKLAREGGFAERILNIIKKANS